MMNKIVLLVVVVLLSAGFSTAGAEEVTTAGAEKVIKEGDVLTLERCVAIALTQHPSIIAAENTMGISQSRIGQARAGYLPQIEASANRSRINPVTGTATAPLGTRPTYDQDTAGVTLNQLLFDFGKTGSQVDIQKRNFEASRNDFSNTANKVRFDVTSAYYDVLLTKKTLEVARETITLYEKMLAQATGFYQAGVKSKYDVTKATVDLSNAKLNEIKASNALKVARVNLKNAMGLQSAPAYDIEGKVSFEKFEIAFESALEQAYRNRPDLLAAIARKEAAQESISLAKKGYLPVLSGNASVNYSNIDGRDTPPQRDDGWAVGATLTFPLFSGFLTTYQVKEAKSNLYVQKANEEAARQTIRLEVEQAYLSLNEAEQRIATTELAVKQAKENLEIAGGRYQAGVGNPIEVADAEVKYSDAKTQFFQALRDYKVAEASIIKAIGKRE